MPANRFTLLRCLIALTGVVTCVVVIVATGRAGYASHLISGSPEHYVPSSVSSASRFAPSDPEVHLASAMMLWRDRRLGEAIKEFENVVRLRPAHFLAWSHLGVAREKFGDLSGAVAAFAEAVRLAPHYAQPRLRYGRALLSLGRNDQAFGELRFVMKSNPALAEQVRTFVWDKLNKDAGRFRQAIQPNTAESQLSLATFLIKQGAITDGIDVFREVGSVPEETRRKMITELLKANRFGEAHELWASGSGGEDHQRRGMAALINGGFEKKMVLNEPGFDWQAMHDLNEIEFSLDTNNSREGQHNLRINFGGNFDTQTKIISQLMLVKPKTRYRLKFAFRSGKLVSGGLPVVVVGDVNASKSDIFAQSDPLPADSAAWQERELDFTTGEETEAVLLSLERVKCETTPCPIFGTVWLDGFALEDVTPYSRRQN